MQAELSQEQEVMEEIALTIRTKVRPKQMTDLVSHADVTVRALQDHAPFLSHLPSARMHQIFRQFVPNNGTLEEVSMLFRRLISAGPGAYVAKMEG